jgi:hypothetical protein
LLRAVEEPPQGRPIPGRAQIDQEKYDEENQYADKTRVVME